MVCAALDITFKASGYDALQCGGFVLHVIALSGCLQSTSAPNWRPVQLLCHDCATTGGGCGRCACLAGVLSDHARATWLLPSGDTGSRLLLLFARHLPRRVVTYYNTRVVA